MTDDAMTVDAVGQVLRSADLLEERLGTGDVAVLGVSQDSRDVVEGDLFLAWAGTDVDAHAFVDQAVEQGAVAVVVEHPVSADVPQLVVSNGRRAAALVAEAFFDSPSEELVMVGVTGTNGKTTTALIIRHLLSADMTAVAIGTLGVFDDRGVRPGSEGLTTPGPVDLSGWLRELADEECGVVVLEASSHALEQYRLDGVRFDVAVFTNLSQDHLNYHGDMEAYREAKIRLVDLLAPEGTLIVKGDEAAWADVDPGGRMTGRYGIEIACDVEARDLILGGRGTEFTVVASGVSHVARTPLLGRYNVENTLAAIAAARAVGVPMEEIVFRLESVPQISGRLESVASEPFVVLIDFAHTPAALEGALSAVKPLTEGRLVVVFGAGGDRDRTKRRPMAEAVRGHADVIFVTSDNPRTEDPEAIIDDVVEGLEGCDFRRITDRKDAIRAALEEARPGDTVLLAGKGHETYQVVGTKKRPFDERKIVRTALREMGVA